MGERIRRARLNAILDGYNAGLRDGDELLSLADKKERQITDKRGVESITHFESVSQKIPEIESLMDSSKTEDREWHADKWVILKTPVHGHKMLPVEVKSSRYGVDEFKNSQDFKRNQIVFVINSGKNRKDKDIINSFKKELDRIAKRLHELDKRKKT